MISRFLNAIGTRLIASYLVIAAVALGIGIVGSNQLTSINILLEQEITSRVESRYLSTTIRTQSSQIAELIRGYGNELSSQELARLDSLVEDSLATLNEIYDQADRNIRHHATSENQSEESAIGEEIRIWNGLALTFQGFLDRAQNVKQTYHSEGTAGVRTQLALNQFEANWSRLWEGLIELENEETSLLYLAQESAQETAQQARVVMLALGTASLFGGVILGVLISGTITRPVDRLVEASRRITAGDYSKPVSVRSRTEVGVLARSFNEMSLQLQEFIGSLEQRVDAATRDLALAAEVGQRVSEVQDLNALLAEAVDVIHQAFDLYYAQIYLVDPTGRSLVLRAGTGEVGMALTRRGHHLPIDGRSLNGLAATERRSIIVEDTQSSEFHRPNPLLPDTRSEMTVPMIAGDRVVGVLDLQSDQVGDMSEEKLSAFDALAAQLAIAIENSNLFAQVEVTQQALEKQARRLSAESWQEFMDAIDFPERLGYAYAREEVLPLEEPLPQTDDENSMMTPIEVLGQKVGALRLEGETTWSTNDAELISSVSEQLSQQIENLRLLSRSERYRREAEQAVRRLTREGWDEIQKQTDAAYMYDGKQVLPLPTNGDGQPNQAAHSFDVLVGDEPVGELNIVGRDTLSEQDQVLVSEINQQISTHIERLRLQQQTNQALSDTEEQAIRLAALNRLSDALNRAETLDAIYQVSAVHLIEIVDADRTSMTRLVDTEEGQMLEIMALQGEGGAIPTGAKIPIEGSAIGEAFTTQREVVIPDLKSSQYLENAQLAKQGLQSSLVIPLIVGGQPIGTVNFGSSVKNAYPESDRDIAVQAVSLIASAIEIRNLFAQTQTALERTDILYDISQSLNEAETDQEIIQIVSRPAFDAGAVSANLISLDLDNAGQPIWAEVKASLRTEGEPPVPIGTRYYLPELPFSNLWISDPDNPIVVPDVHSDERLDDVSKGIMEQSGSRSLVIIPLTQAGERLGLIVINFAEPHEFSAQEIDIYRALIDLTSPVLRSRNLFERTQLEADQEALINRISQQIQGTTNVDDALQVTIRELGRALNAKWTSVQLG